MPDAAFPVTIAFLTTGLQASGDGLGPQLPQLGRRDLALPAHQCRCGWLVQCNTSDSGIPPPARSDGAFSGLKEVRRAHAKVGFERSPTTTRLTGEPLHTPGHVVAGPKATAS